MMLYFVGLPIGNLKDITFRAVEVLKSVDVIACEDTRKTLGLLNFYEIKKHLISYHKFNEQKASEKIIKMLKDNKNIAVVTDSGMPSISDPGNVLVLKLKENQLSYTVVPGPSAFVSALVLSGFDAKMFTFASFLPQKNVDRINWLEKLKNLPQTIVFYISPHSLQKDIETIFSVFKRRKACLVKEITKIHEGVYDFFLGDEIDINMKGEFVLLVEGNKEFKENINISVEKQIEEVMSQGKTQNQAISVVAKKNSMTKQELYKKVKVK